MLVFFVFFDCKIGGKQKILFMQVRLPRLGGEPLPQLKAANRGSSGRASSGEGTPLESKKLNGGFEGKPAGSELALADVGSRERLAAKAKDGAEPAKRVKTDTTSPEVRR